MLLLIGILVIPALPVFGHGDGDECGPSYIPNAPASGVAIKTKIRVLPKISIQVNGGEVVNAVRHQKVVDRQGVSNLGTVQPQVGHGYLDLYEESTYNVKVWSNRAWRAFITRSAGNMDGSELIVKYNKGSDQDLNPYTSGLTEIWRWGKTGNDGVNLGDYLVKVFYDWNSNPGKYHFDLIFLAYQE